MNLEDKKKVKAKNSTKSPGKKLIQAKVVVPTKAQRGFTTKKPSKVHLSYPL